MQEILKTIWNLINTPAGITAIAGAFIWLLNRLYAKKPAWQRFEGSIISAVKYAEKAIPDETENKGLHRLDSALRYVLAIYKETTRKDASEEVKAEIKEGIQIVHARLEGSGLRPGDK